MNKITVLISLFAIVLSIWITTPARAKVSAKRRIAIPAVCDLAESLYMPGELLVTMKESDDLKFMSRFLPEKTVHGMKMSRIKSKLKTKTKKHKITAMEDLYEPDFNSMNKSKSRLKKALKLSNYEKHLNQRKLSFNKAMLESSPARTVVLKSENKTCKSMEKLIKDLSNDKDVEHVGLNRKMQLRTLVEGTPNDPKYAEQWHLTNIQADEAWSISTGVNAIVGIIDDAFWQNHEDLDVIVDPDFGFENGSMSHGTLVSGTAGARGDNALGIVGVAPDVAMRFTSGGYFADSDVIAAINHHVNHNSDVINMSFGFYESRNIVEDALYQTVVSAIDSGVTVVVASGNDDIDVTSHPHDLVFGGNVFCSGSIAAPCFDYFSVIPGVISVAATERNNERADFSNFGADIDIAAPGSDILTTSFAYDLSTGTFTNTYEAVAGTSFASPIVAGVVALMVAKARESNVELTPAAISEIITKGANTDRVEGSRYVLKRRLPAVTKPIGRKVNASKSLMDLNRYLAVDQPNGLVVDVNGSNIHASWNTTSYAFSGYKYVLNKSDLQVRTGEVSSNSLDLGSLIAGDYTLLVQACNSVTCSDYSSTGFTIEDTSMLLPGAVVVTSHSNNTLINANAIIFRWNPVANASRYESRIYLEGGLVEPFSDIGIETQSVFTGLLFERNYIFEVRAINSAGEAGPVTSLKFATGVKRPRPQIESSRAPAAPQLRYPQQSLVTTDRDVTFTWDEVARADFYRVKLEYKANPSDGFDHYKLRGPDGRRIDSFITQNSLLASDLPVGFYRLTVRAFNTTIRGNIPSEIIKGVNRITSFVIAEEATELPQPLGRDEIEVEATSSGAIELSWIPEDKIVSYNIRLRNFEKINGKREEVFVVYALFTPNAIEADGRYHYTIDASQLTGGFSGFDAESFPAGVEASVRGRNSQGFGQYGSPKFRLIRF